MLGGDCKLTMRHLSLAWLFLASLAIVGSQPTGTSYVAITDAVAAPSCFPALGFTMPSKIPSSLTNWWCSYDKEYAFVGFSYEITSCENPQCSRFPLV